jgi:hypothetical protein
LTSWSGRQRAPAQLRLRVHTQNSNKAQNNVSASFSSPYFNEELTKLCGR